MADEKPVPETLDTIAEKIAALSQEVTRLETRITEEGKDTRRHFDVMLEGMQDSVKIVAEATAHHSNILGDHEARLQTIEKRR